MSSSILQFNDLMILRKEEAIKKYGKPQFAEQFQLNSKLGPFRYSLYKVFSNEEITKQTIRIDELTWEKDNENWITVWYESVNGMPKTHHKWKKGMDFYSQNNIQ